MLMLVFAGNGPRKIYGKLQIIQNFLLQIMFSEFYVPFSFVSCACLLGQSKHKI